MNGSIKILFSGWIQNGIKLTSMNATGLALNFYKNIYTNFKID